MKMILILSSFLSLIFCLAVSAHSGGTDSDGCHVQSSTNTRHCHNDEDERSYRFGAFGSASPGTTLNFGSNSLGLKFFDTGSSMLSYQRLWELQGGSSEWGLELGILLKEMERGGEIYSTGPYLGTNYNYILCPTSLGEFYLYWDLGWKGHAFISSLGISFRWDFNSAIEYLKQQSSN